MDIAVKFFIGSGDNTVLNRLDLKKLEDVLVYAGDSDKTLNGLDNVCYEGFICQNKEQFNYLKEHLNKIIKEVDSAIAVETGVYGVEPVCMWGRIRNGEVYELAYERTEDDDGF